MNGTRGLLIAAIASLVVGISAGLVAGILLMRFAGPDRPGPPFRRELIRRIDGHRGPRMHGDQMMLLHRIEEELDLTPEQRTRIVAILERARVEHMAARESVRVRVERELTADQQKRWKEMEDRYRRSWERRAGRRGPFGGPP